MMQIANFLVWTAEAGWRRLQFNWWCLLIGWRQGCEQSNVMRGAPDWVVMRFIACGVPALDNAAVDEMALRLIRMSRDLHERVRAAQARQGGEPKP